jgi:hypothetical protein
LEDCGDNEVGKTFLLTVIAKAVSLSGQMASEAYRYQPDSGGHRVFGASMRDVQEQSTTSTLPGPADVCRCQCDTREIGSEFF